MCFYPRLQSNPIKKISMEIPFPHRHNCLFKLNPCHFNQVYTTSIAIVNLFTLYRYKLHDLFYKTETKLYIILGSKQFFSKVMTFRTRLPTDLLGLETGCPPLHQSTAMHHIFCDFTAIQGTTRNPLVFFKSMSIDIYSQIPHQRPPH